MQGLKFDAMRELLAERIRKRKLGVNVSVAFDELKASQVFVLGDVKQPGSFTVSALSNVTNALLVSGGVNKRGSLRSIQL